MMTFIDKNNNNKVMHLIHKGDIGAQSISTFTSSHNHNHIRSLAD